MDDFTKYLNKQLKNKEKKVSEKKVSDLFIFILPTA